MHYEAYFMVHILVLLYLKEFPFLDLLYQKQDSVSSERQRNRLQTDFRRFDINQILVN